MTDQYQLDDNDIALPQDPEFGGGRDIDSPDWDTVQGVAHWHAERRGVASPVFWDPNGLPLSAASLQVVAEDGTIGGDADAAGFVDPQRGEAWHDDWTETSDYMMMLLALMEVDLDGGASDGIVEVALDFAKFGFGSSSPQEDTSGGGPDRTPVLQSDAGETSKIWYARHFILRRQTSGPPTWCVPVAGVDVDGDLGDLYAVVCRQVQAVNESTFEGDLLIWGAPYITAPLVSDGAGVETWESEDAELELTSASDPLPTRQSGALNAGSTNHDQTDGVSFTGGNVFSVQAPDWAPEGFFFALAVTRDTTDAASVYEIYDIGATSQVLLVEQTSTDVKVSLTTSGGTFTVSTAHGGTGQWEGWEVYWEESGDLVLYLKDRKSVV